MFPFFSSLTLLFSYNLVLLESRSLQNFAELPVFAVCVHTLTIHASTILWKRLHIGPIFFTCIHLILETPTYLLKCYFFFSFSYYFFIFCIVCDLGLYYDGNNGIWYSYDHHTQQYIPCTDQNQNKSSNNESEPSKAPDGSSTKKVVISAPATTVTSNEKPASLADAVQAAAAAALAAEKKEKEKSKEIKLASKSSILANKKKMNNVLTMWKQRSHEGQATRVALEDNQLTGSVEDKSYSSAQSAKNKLKTEASPREISASNLGHATAQVAAIDSQPQPRPFSNSLGGTLMGVIRGSGRGVVKSDTSYSGSTSTTPSMSASSANVDAQAFATPFKTDVSSLGSYTPSASVGSGRRRFSEMPLSASTHKEQSQTTTYRDRAAERRSLYGSSSSVGNDLSDLEIGDSSKIA